MQKSVSLSSVVYPLNLLVYMCRVLSGVSVRRAFRPRCLPAAARPTASAARIASATHSQRGAAISSVGGGGGVLFSSAALHRTQPSQPSEPS